MEHWNRADSWMLILFSVVAIVCCTIPLLDLLGYESASVMGIAASFSSIVYSRSFVRNRLVTSMQGTGLSPFILFTRQVGRLWVFLLLPGLILTLNSFRVPNCDWGTGLMFWSSIPTVSIVVYSAFYYFFAAFTSRWALLLTILVVFFDLGSFAWRLAMEPPIMGFSWTFGWFAGSIYDEALSFPVPLFWHQLQTLCLSLILLLVPELLWRHRSYRVKSRYLLMGLIALGVWFEITMNAANLNIRHTGESVKSALGGRAESEHAIVYFQADTLDAKSEMQLLEDIEFRYAELLDFFEVDIVEWRGRKMEIFIYPNVNRQHDLIGSRHTLVARPWTHQMHIRYEEFGSYILVHEMAHLFSAAFAGELTQLPVDRYGIPHIGLVEGLAVAADWSPSELSIHDKAAALVQMEKSPNIRTIFQLQGFWTQPSGKAYTMVGSFVRWLIDTHGVEPMKALYGEIDFKKHYGQSSEALITEWEEFLANQSLSQRQLALARYRYDYGSMNRSIFEKTCARTLAEIERRQHGAMESLRYGKALRLLDELDSFRPNNEEYLLRRARLYAETDRWDEALLIVDDLLQRGLPQGLKAEILELKGDLLWRLFRLDEATTAYGDAMEMGVGDARMRGLVVKRDALTNPDPSYQSVVQKYLVTSGDWMVDFYELQLWKCSEQGGGIPQYLTGRVLFERGAYPEAIENLIVPTMHPNLEAERKFDLAIGYYWLGSYDLATAILLDLKDQDSRRIELLAEEWLLRAEWRKEWPGLGGRK